MQQWTTRYNSVLLPGARRKARRMRSVVGYRDVARRRGQGSGGLRCVANCQGRSLSCFSFDMGHPLGHSKSMTLALGPSSASICSQMLLPAASGGSRNSDGCSLSGSYARNLYGSMYGTYDTWHGGVLRISSEVPYTPDDKALQHIGGG